VPHRPDGKGWEAASFREEASAAPLFVVGERGMRRDGLRHSTFVAVAVARPDVVAPAQTGTAAAAADVVRRPSSVCRPSSHDDDDDARARAPHVVRQTTQTDPNHPSIALYVRRAQSHFAVVSPTPKGLWLFCLWIEFSFAFGFLLTPFS
jgi:hypothetical protein